MGLLLLDFESIEEPLKLPARDGLGFLVFLLWPAEAPALQASVVEPETVVIPGEDLEFVPVFVAEDEEALAEEIQREDLTDDCGQAVDGLS
jgi:hypothetical protein